MDLRQTAYISLAFVLERFRFDFQYLYRYLNLSWKISSTIPNVHFPRFRSSEAMITTSPIDSVDGFPWCFKLCLSGKARRYWRYSIPSTLSLHFLRYLARFSEVSILFIMRFELIGRLRRSGTSDWLGRRDGIIHAAKLKTPNGHSERAVNHLYPLELLCDQSSNQQTA